MRHYKLRGAQSAVLAGLTDLWVITHADLTQATVATDEVEDLDAVEFGDIVSYDCFMQILVPFTPQPSADAGLNVTLGVNGALTQFIGNSALMAAGVATAAKTAYVPVAAGVPYAVPTGGKTLQANFDITDADGALATFTAGELAIGMRIQRYSELFGQAQL
jgi:hypothetical protein